MKGERVTIVWDVETDTISAAWQNAVGSCPLGTFDTFEDAVQAAQEALAAVEKMLEEKQADPPA
jgi:hypothetical protein